MSQHTTFRPSASAGVDTYLEGTQPNVNFGTSGSIYVGSQSFGKSYAHQRGLIQFDLRSLIGALSIDSAELDLQGFNHLTADAHFYLYRCTRTNWTELGACWSKYDGTNNWTTPGGDVDPAASLRHNRLVYATDLNPPLILVG